MTDEIPRGALGTCQEVLDLLSEYVNGELTAANVTAIDRHLAGCPPCERFLDSLKRTVDWTQQMKIDKVPPEVATRLRHFLRSKVQNKDDD